MKEDIEARIASALAERRRADEASAPDFGLLLGRARRSAHAHALRWALPLAATLVLAAGSIWLGSRSRSAPRASEVVPALSIAAWKAPTDSLLENPGAELLKEIPELAPPVSVSPPIEGIRSEKSRTPERKS